MSTVRHMQGRPSPKRRTPVQNRTDRSNRHVVHTPERNKTEDMFNVIRQLNDVLTKENAALKRHKVEDVRLLGEKKTGLAKLYQQQMNAIHRNPDLLKNMEETKRTALAQARIRLTDLMKENANLLRGNIKVINTFMKTVVDAVRERQEKKSTSYSESGNLDGYAAVKRNMAVSFNEVT